jgi:hypothetical protein
MATRTDDPARVVVEALIGGAGARDVLALTAPAAPPIAARKMTAAAATATAGSVTQRFMNA